MCSDTAEPYRVVWVVHWAHLAGCGGGGLRGAPWWEAMNHPGLVAASVSTPLPAKPPPFRRAHGDQTSLRKSSSYNAKEKWWRSRCCRHVEGDIVGAWLETHFWKGVTHIRAGIPLMDCRPWAIHPVAEETRRKEQ